jgi:hypothetical protein
MGFRPQPRQDGHDIDGFSDHQELMRLPVEVLKGLGRTAIRDIQRLGRSRWEDERQEGERVASFARRLKRVIDEKEGQPGYASYDEPAAIAETSSSVCPICRTSECRHNS